MQILELLRLAYLSTASILSLLSYDQYGLLHAAEESHYFPEGVTSQYNTSSSSFELANSSLQERTLPDLPQPKVPHGPYFSGFETQDQLNCAARAFTDAWQIILRARVRLHDCNHPIEQNPTFLRYFRPQDVDWVRKRFDWISGTDFQGPEVMAQRIQAPEGEVQALTVRYHYPRNGKGLCDIVPNLGGFMDQRMVDAYWQADMVLCPHLFQYKGPKSIEEATSNNCKWVTDRPTPGMLVPGTVIVHELLHWRQMELKQYNIGFGHVGDFNSKKFPNIDPPSGYGSYNAKRLQDLGPGRGTVNADSFVWFAMELFYLVACRDANGNVRASFNDPRAEEWGYVDVNPD